MEGSFFFSTYFTFDFQSCEVLLTSGANWSKFVALLKLCVFSVLGLYLSDVSCSICAKD